MEDTTQFRLRAREHRVAARTTEDLWESVIRYSLAARYEELAARAEAPRHPAPEVKGRVAEPAK